MNFSVIPNFFINKFPKQVRFLASHKSEFLTGIGIISGMASTIWACKATLKFQKVLDNAQDNLELINEARELVISEAREQDFTLEDARKDKIMVYVYTVGETGKLYGPPVVLGAISIACIIGGHNILRRENAALAAAFTGVTEAFRRYRKRIEEAYGADKEREFYLGAEKVSIECTDESGKKKKTTVKVVEPGKVSQYARWYDESNSHWTRSPELNLTFLRSQQNWANDLYKSRGHLLLNEVYDMLGLPRSQAGCVVGWAQGYGDDYVDFGIYDGVSQTSKDFVNGFRESVLLDFNVSGPIDHLLYKVEKRFSDQQLADARVRERIVMGEELDPAPWE